MHNRISISKEELKEKTSHLDIDTRLKLMTAFFGETQKDYSLTGKKLFKAHYQLEAMPLGETSTRFIIADNYTQAVKEIDSYKVHHRRIDLVEDDISLVVLGENQE